MPTIKMSDATVRSLKAPPGARVEYFDQATGGLALRVSGPPPSKPDGECGRVWCLYYRQGGKQARLTLGKYPGLSLAGARVEAAEATRLREKGGDPRAVKREAQAAAARQQDTIETVLEQFMKRHMEGKGRADAYIKGFQRNFDNHVLPQWRGRGVASITRREVIELMDKVHDGGGKVRRDGKTVRMPGGPIAARRVRAAVRVFFGWCLKRDIIEANPAANIEAPGVETQRDRSLTDDEVRQFWQAADAIGSPFGPYLQVTLLTAQRRSEVAGMRRQDLDLEAGTWLLSGASTKNKREHLVPLSPQVVAILRCMPGVTYRNAEGRLVPSNFVFTTNGSAPISGFARAMERLAEKIAKQPSERHGETKPQPFTIHDLRRTAATDMAKLGTTQFIVGKVLNHTDRSVTAVYNRYEYIDEKRVALRKWAAYVESLTNPSAGNVVPMHSAVAAE